MRYAAVNFGIRTVTAPCETDPIAAQIACYDAGPAAQVTARIREEATLSGTMARLPGLYREVIAANASLGLHLMKRSPAP